MDPSDRAGRLVQPGDRHKRVERLLPLQVSDVFAPLFLQNCRLGSHQSLLHRCRCTEHRFRREGLNQKIKFEK